MRCCGQAWTDSPRIWSPVVGAGAAVTSLHGKPSTPDIDCSSLNGDPADRLATADHQRVDDSVGSSRVPVVSFMPAPQKTN
jgi:hypothetical protein